MNHLRRKYVRALEPLGLLLFGGSLVLIGCAGCGERESPRRGRHRASADAPNVILLTIDTLRADHLGAYGYARDTSLHIDRFAAEGLLFEQAGVQWPKTNPSFASMLTGTYCSTNMVRHYSAPIDPRLTMLAEMLHEEELYTCSFVANPHLGRFFNFDQGFDEMHEMWAQREQAHFASIRPAGVLPNDVIGRAVVQWLDEHQRRRFFLWVHLLDPHGPYQPPDDLAGRFIDDETFATQQRMVAPDKVPYYQQQPAPFTYVLGDYVARYDAEIADVDRTMGTILARIDELGLRDQSLVILGADHGESFGEHKDYYFDHGEYQYEACLRVPLILRWPGRIPAGRRIDTPVALIDLVPTLLELLKIDAAHYAGQIQGASLASLLAGESYEPRPIFTEGKQQQLSVRSGKWKLILDPRHNPLPGSTQATPQLYDLKADPMEQRDLAAENPAVVIELTAELETFRRAQEANIGKYETMTLERGDISPEITDEMLERLRALGYTVLPSPEPEEPNRR